MHLRLGIPLLAEVEQLEQQDEFQQHRAYNDRFLHAHRRSAKRYGRQWAVDPLQSWSRRWEYPFAWQRVEAFAREHGDQPLRVLDAGSGVTYFPYFLADRLPGVKALCCDSDCSYARMFAAINRSRGENSVSFVASTLESLPFGAGTLDAVCCISVLEHTNDYCVILDEFRRVLRRGGLLVLTFDLSLDGRFNMSRARAAALLSRISERFADNDVDHEKELARLDRPDEILTTDYARQTRSELLPWKYPQLTAVRDLLCGHGWTGGFHSLSCYCLHVRSKP